MKIKNNVAIITGSSRGIGRAIALALAKKGARIVINYILHKKEAFDVHNCIKDMGNEVLLIKADVKDFCQAKTIFEKAIDTFGMVGILINNAGIIMDKTIKKMSLQEWQTVIDVDLTGVFNCTRNAIEHMIERKEGKIINIASFVGQAGNIGQTNYAAAKAGVIGFTKALAKEVGKYGITVNAIAPGFIETDMLRVLSPEIRTRLLKQIPLGRFGKPEEVAQAAILLIENDYITGSVINVNGGVYM